MKKVWMFLLLLFVVAASYYLYLYQHYSVASEKFAGWHSSMKAGLADAQKRNVPMMVSVSRYG